MSHDEKCTCTRRGALRSIVGSSLLMPAIISELLAAESGTSSTASAALQPHFPPRAKRVIFLFMTGGVSHVDSFDPKPALIRDDGKKIEYDPNPDLVLVGGKNPDKYLVRPKYEFKPHGKSGIEVSDLFPHMAECVDDICLIRSMRNDNGGHFEATLGIHTGSVSFARPSFGSWVSYGLGSMNQNLPTFMVIAPELPYAGAQVWGSDFLPGAHQGVRIRPGEEPIPNMLRRAGSAELQNMELGLIEYFNRRHQVAREGDPALAARIKSFETAFGMQQEAPEAFDVSKESDATLKLYGLERGSKQGFAWQCLVARRLAERGVRFVELIDIGTSNEKNWDAHSDILANYTPLAKNVDQPIAALLQDLKSRGMLDDTLVVWTTEFGRTPYHVQPHSKGREHHASAYSSWLAGGGVKRGFVYGATDEHGIVIAQNPVGLNDFHATLLHLLGLDHKRLTFRHAGRDFRLTDVAGEVIEPLLA